MDIAELLMEAKQRRASDLHVSAGSPPMLRIHGEMTPVASEPVTREQVHQMLYDILPDRIKAEFEETRDVDFAMELSGVGRFRCNIFVQRNGEGAVFRYIPSTIMSFEELGLPDAVRQLARKESGLVLVTGPTGSGKSTTLATMIDLINTERRGHIITIEDPIEFTHQSKNCLVNQREVRSHTRDFASALRAALREDPDVILVGEMRDYETISLAVTAAETGHLVLGTLHTMSAAKTIDRVIDVFPANRQEEIRAMLASSLQGVISQLLLRTSDGMGRVLALEIMICTAAIRNLIRDKKVFQIPSVIETSRAMGMVTLEQSLRDLLAIRRVTPEEAMRKAKDLESLELLIHHQVSGSAYGHAPVGSGVRYQRRP